MRAKRLLRGDEERGLHSFEQCSVRGYVFFASSVVCTRLHNRQLDLNWNCRFRGEIGWQVDQLGSSRQQQT